MRATSPTIEKFSAGYYVLSGLYIKPAETYTVRMNDVLYDEIKSYIGGGRDVSVVLKQPEHGEHLAPEPTPSVATDVLELPYEVVSDMDLDRTPAQRALLLAKPQHAKLLTSMQDEPLSLIK